MVYGTQKVKTSLWIVTNADWEGSVDEWKSTTGATFYFRNCLVSWLSKKQSSIALSTTDVEYNVVVSCCSQVIWMKHALEDLLVKYEHPIVINCDNTSAINISKHPVMHSKTKHIPIKYHFLRDQVSQKVVKLEYVDTRD